jgi:hypothetical protein
LLRPAVDFRHQEDFLPIAVAQSVSHLDFTLTVAVVVVPGIVHESDAVIDAGADNLGGEVLVFGLADIGTAQANAGYFLAGATKSSIQHVAAALFFGRSCGERAGREHSAQKQSSIEVFRHAGKSANGAPKPSACAGSGDANRAKRHQNKRNCTIGTDPHESSGYWHTGTSALV